MSSENLITKPIDIAVFKLTCCLVGAIFIGGSLGPLTGFGIFIVAVGIMV